MSRAVTEAQVSLARRLVVHESRDAQASSSLDRIYKKMFERLAPIIGAAGVHALFARAVERARAETSSIEFTPGADPREAFRPSIEAFARITPQAAHDAATAIMARFLHLLATVMGTELTAQILRVAWHDIDIELDDRSDRAERKHGAGK